MIDVLAFPPDGTALDALRAGQLAPGRRLEQHSRIARFVSFGLALAWAADVGAAFGARGSAHPVAFAIASIALAFTIVAANFVANRLAARAVASRRTTEGVPYPPRITKPQRRVECQFQWSWPVRLTSPSGVRSTYTWHQVNLV